MNEQTSSHQHHHKAKPSYVLPSIMWCLTIAFYAYQYFLQVSPSVMTNELMRDFGVNATALGSLAACYFYAYASMQIPVGLAYDRFCVRRPMVIAALVCSLGCYLFAATNIFAVTVIGRLLIGFGGAFVIVGNMYLAGIWLPLRLFSFLVGAGITVGMIGATCGQAPLAMLVNAVGWHKTMYIFSGIGISLAAVMWLVMRDLPKINFPEEEQKAEANAAKEKPSILLGLKLVMRNRQIWLIALQGGLIFMTISVFGSLWGTPFLMRKYNISNTVAGGLLTMLYIGLAIGTPFFGWLSEYIQRRQRVMLISAFGSFCCLTAVIYLPVPMYIASALLFTYSFFAGGSLVCFTAVRENDTSNSTGAALGFTNTLNMLGGAIIQPVVGLLLDWGWDGAMVGGIRAYSLGNFQSALILLSIGLAIAFVLILFIKESYKKT
jgi:sugar phosphate permease